MTTSTSGIRRRILAAPARLRVRLRRRAGDADGGFILLESIIAISLITVIMGAVGAEYLTHLASSSRERAETVASHLADSTMEVIRSLHASDLNTGRDNASTLADYTTLTAIAAVAPFVSSSVMTRAYDGTVSSGGASAAVPTGAVVQTPGAIKYSIYRYLGYCWTARTGGNCTSTSAAVSFLRVVIAVVWTQRGCAANTCSYVTSTLINPLDDPTFDLNQTLPDAPQITQPDDQSVAVGDTVSLQLLVKNNTGVAPFTWALTTGTLPTGLALNTAGLISGTVGGSPASASSVKVTVTDAFLRTASVTFSWTVLARLTITSTSAQANTTADSVSYQLTASGGSGTGYKFTDPSSTLPAGLSMTNAGLITGTPTSVGTYTVRPTVVDSTGTRTATASFTWTIAYPPLSLSNPGAQTATVNAVLSPSLTFTTSGGDGNYTYSATGLPSGLSINAGTGTISGTPTGTQSATTVTVTVADASAGVASKSSSFSLTVVAQPSINTPSTQKTTIGAAVSLTTSATCPNTPCTYTLANQPNGLTIDSSTGTISGTVASNAATSTTVRVTITDADGASVATSSFTWTIFAAPTVTGLGTAKVTETGVNSTALGYTCPYTTCLITLSGSVPGIGLTTASSSTADNSTKTTLTVSSTSGTVYLTGTVLTTAVTSGTSKAYTPSLTIKDGGNFTPAAVSATWTAYTPPTATGMTDRTSGTARPQRGTAVSQAITYTCPIASCTFTYTGAPSGLGLNAAASGGTLTTSLTVSATSGTIYFRGTVSSTAATGNYAIDINIDDAYGVDADSTATWTVR